MKKSVLYIFLITFSLFSLSGCSFLRGGESDDYLDDGSVGEAAFEDSDEFDMDEDEEGFEGFSSGNLDGGFDDEGFDEGEGEDLAKGDVADDDLGDLSELDDEDEWEVEEEQEEGKRKGFFARLFGGEKKNNDENLQDDFYVEEDSFEVEESSQEVVFQEEESEEEIQEVAENTNETPSPSSLPAEEEEAESSDSTEVQVTEEESSEPVRQSLNKVLEFAYNKSGFLVNAVYIARQGETLQSISQTIYGQDKSTDLLAINSHLANRSVVVGDKIYYNSPNRPNDNKRIVFYYKDNGQTPLYYDLSEGENIRTIASQLLGHPNSWKEIWATNSDIQSKGASEGNFRIAYWTGASSPQVQESVASQPAPQEPTPQENLAQAEPPAESSNEFNPPPLPNNPEQEDSSGVMADLEKPSPQEEPLQEKPQEPSSSKELSIVSKLLQGQSMQSLAIVAFILFVFIFLLLRLILKKRQEREFDYTSV